MIRERFLMTKSRRRVLVLLLIGVITAACVTLERQAERVLHPQQPPEPSRVAQLLPFGNPSNAAAEISNKNNFLIFKRSFALSYNNERGTANWIAWRTTMNDLGDSLPRPDFRPDPDLPIVFARIVSTDYSRSGYDRGHMVPSADRFGDPATNADTFLMTNIVPQSADLNQYVWEKLERYARGIVRRGSDVYTIAGVYGTKERFKGRLAAPTNCWKIIVVLPPGGSALTIDENTRVIAVDIPNENGIKNIYWQRFRVPVRTIEQKTGFDFFSDLPRELQEKLETKIDNE
jgi:endonuclease G, mitochondrial